MIKNYLKLSLKSILSQRQQSVVSIIGLSVALSCSILILLYVEYEFSYDKYHKNADHIYRVVTKQSGNSYMGKDVFAVTPGPLKEALIDEIPEVKNSTKCFLTTHTLEYNSSLFTENGFLYTDTDFLKIFTFPVISGDPVTALKESFTLFMTKEMASKYFGTEDPIGKIIIADNNYVFTVRGILENIPDNSHFDFDFLTGFETYYFIRGGKENVERWGSNSYITYFQLMENVKPEDINDKLEKLYSKYNDKNNRSIKIKLVAEPLKGIHLGGKINFEPGNNNDIRYIFLISSIGLLIILIACFNYMNMATARSYNRGREIGILKVAGSSKRNLIIQFITESVLLSAGGLILALVIVWFILPIFSSFTDRPLTYGMIFEYSIFIKIIAIMIFAGIFAGIYPAFHLASFSPLHLMKEDFKYTGRKRRSGYLRNMLVMLQYIISIVALICTFTVLRQLYFVKYTDLGFVRDNIINVMLRDPAIQKNPEVLIRELSTNSKIEDITASASLPLTINSNSRGNWEGKPEETNLNIYKAGIGNNFIDFYNLKIVSGREFSYEYSTDTINSFIINQTAAKMIGWDDPIGKKFGFDGDMGIVIGVIKDFYFHSLHLAIEPLALSAIGSDHFKETRYISIKVNPGTISEMRIFIEKKLKELSPHYLNPLSNLSDRIDQMYSSERMLVTIFIFSSALAIILTCLGQYSLSSYTTKSRTKEMVIRKVMGAQSSEIMALFTGEFAIWIFVSILVAWPVAYLIMTRWLQNFAYHIEIGVTVFLLALLISLFISLTAISYHVIKLSVVNPAEMIRHE